MHPGDVRKFRAVDIRELHHIRDCIVFPSKGPRPHPDEMAGSDLDGDEYAIFWDANLFISKNKEAMNFPCEKAQVLDHDATLDDILDFYCAYVRDNAIGLVASSHLAFADRYPKGIFDPICLALAKKYALHLDFAKTGKCAPLLPKERAYYYPDFMDKASDKPTYSSRKTLGKLFRQCINFELCLNDQLQFEDNNKPDMDLTYPGK